MNIFGVLFDDGDEKRWSWLLVSGNEKQVPCAAWDRADVESPVETEARYITLEWERERVRVAEICKECMEQEDTAG